MSQETDTDKREYAFTPRDFDRVRKLIREHAGIQLGDNKQDMVYGRITRRIRAKKMNSFAHYLNALEHDAEEWEEFINSLTTNLTSFFREEYHFPILADFIRENRGRRMRLWCSAASTGEEPYSMAMTAIQASGVSNPSIEIIATDIDTKVLAEAEAGVYPLERLRRLPADKLAFFHKGTGSNAGKARIRQEVRNLVTFKPLNLLDKQWDIQAPFDAIFCRNVLIYFDRATQRQLVERFSPLLTPSGLLFIGHSETLSHDKDLFKLRGQTVYEGCRYTDTAARSKHAA
jgi:chemotaxis protein methyltransferase CheR